MDGRIDKLQNEISPLDCKWAKIGIPETSSKKRTDYELCYSEMILFSVIYNTHLPLKVPPILSYLPHFTHCEINLLTMQRQTGIMKLARKQQLRYNYMPASQTSHCPYAGNIYFNKSSGHTY